MKEAAANKHHKSIICAIRAEVSTWEFEQINSVVGNCGSIIESDFYTKIKKIDVLDGNKDRHFDDLVTQTC